MIDPHSFRQAMGLFATGVTVVTTRNGAGESVGITVNSFASVSLDPPLISFCLDRKTHLFDTFRKAEIFAVNMLAANQIPASQHFANYRKFAPPPRLWAKPQMGCPLLNGTLGWVICRKTAAYKGGDHVIFLGEIVKLSVKPKKAPPLLYFRGAYRNIKD